MTDLAFPTLDEALKRWTTDHRAASGVAMLDNRDLARLARWLTTDQLAEFGVLEQAVNMITMSGETPAEPAVPVEPEPWTPESVYAQIHRDIEFACDKARNERGISASLMADVLEMWATIFQIELGEYRNYGRRNIEIMAKAFTVELDWDED